MRNLVLIMLYVSSITVLFSQDLPNVVPSTPNVASFDRYLETPVNYYTGVPSINIPFYSVTEGNINVPISLSYHAGGVKVEDVASWVGTNWSLNSGGTVSRIVKGKPDDMKTFGFIHTTKTLESSRDYVAYQFGDFFSLLDQSMASQSLDFFNNYDTESDIYKFSFLGYSGTFFYNQKQKIFVQTPYSDIKIEPKYSSISKEILGWVFTVPNGMKFYFGIKNDGTYVATDKNRSSVSFSVDQNGDDSVNSNFIPTHTMTWHLVEIISPNNRTVNFKYFKYEPNTQTFSRSGDSEIINHSLSDYNRFSQSVVGVFQDQYFISEIECSNGRVIFERESVKRKDHDSYALKSISVLDKSNNLVKRLKLNYFYSQSSNAPNNLDYLGDAQKRKSRLFLSEVYEENVTNSNQIERLPSHIFSYNDPNALPSRFSNAQDYWGFYNGKHTNQNLIPKLKLPTFSNFLSIGSYYRGYSDRSVDTIMAKKGVLKEITYPTGGKVNYEYETNTVSELIGAFSKKQYYTGNYNYNLSNRLKNGSVLFEKSNTNKVNDILYEKVFTIPANSVGPVKVNVNILTGCSTSIDTNPSCEYRLSIKGISNPSYNYVFSSKLFDLDLVPGTYKIVAQGSTTFAGGGLGTIDGVGGTSPSANFRVYMYNYYDETPDHLNVGGLRVKKITLTDENNVQKTETYSYNKFGSTLTSGFSSNNPFFFDDYVIAERKRATRLSSSSMSSLFFENRGVISYENITKTVSNTYKTEYTFSKPEIYPHIESTTHESMLKNIPNIHLTWKEGHLLKEVAYKKDGNQINSNYTPVRQQINNYSSYGQLQYDFIGVKLIKDPQLNAYRFAKYLGYSEWYRLKSTVITEKFDNTDIIQRIEYKHSSSTPSIVNQEKITNSKGEIITTNRKFAHDFNNTRLISQNRISEPLQVETIKTVGVNSTTLSKQNTIYKDFGNSIYMPEKVQTSKGSQILEDRVVFHSYDNKGNPTEVSKKDGTSVVYIWGYNQTQPIAKIEGATLSTIPSATITNLQTLSNNDNDRSINTTGSEGALRVALNNLRNLTALKEALVTTFTYDPLVGVTSITDPRGETIYYEYDEFNRLKLIRNSEGHIVTEHQYNYKN
ncbi:RHS repeat domain-containing protein [uncultured Tenacibaculum sp.]|uniref:RHS repeat domain-containing protein n=1 Tax=uncultured Tenacibaculum sp. TaxID=174713 RepID=UPI00262F8610|nr:RHS repeat domain-containing protein [uncultured Tenacibaculum sp.]